MASTLCWSPGARQCCRHWRRTLARSHGVNVRVIAADLSDPQAAGAISWRDRKACRRPSGRGGGLRVDRAVSSAGRGVRGEHGRCELPLGRSPDPWHRGADGQGRARAASSFSARLSGFRGYRVQPPMPRPRALFRGLPKGWRLSCARSGSSVLSVAPGPGRHRVCRARRHADGPGRNARNRGARVALAPCHGGGTVRPGFWPSFWAGRWPAAALGPGAAAGADHEGHDAQGERLRR